VYFGHIFTCDYDRQGEIDGPAFALPDQYDRSGDQHPTRPAFTAAAGQLSRPDSGNRDVNNETRIIFL